MFDFKDNSKILITGIAGGLARITAHLIHRHYPKVQIVGIDNRVCEDNILKTFAEVHRVRYSRNDFEKVFREHNFDVVLHLGRPSHIATNFGADLVKRLNFNLVGTNKILDLSLHHHVKKIIVLSTFHVYGALVDNPVYIKEDSVLRASIKFPELRDVVEMDQIATSWMWKYKTQVDTVILRPCNIIGPQINNTMTKYLKSNYAPLPIDYNPMFQFVHEFDMASVLLESILKVPTGIYNVAGPGVISIREAKKRVGSESVPIPISLIEPLSDLVTSKVWQFPKYLLEYMKYSCIIDTQEIEKFLSKDIYKFGIQKALELMKL